MKRIFLIALLALVAGCSPSKQEAKSPDDIGSIELTDLKGEPVDLSDLKGKVVFVNFWATWCRPCLEEMPSIMRLRDQLSPDDVVFYFASDEELDRISGFVEKRKFTGNFVVAKNEEQLGIQALPTTFIYDKSGKRVFSEVGYKNWDEPTATAIVTDLLKK